MLQLILEKTGSSYGIFHSIALAERLLFHGNLCIFFFKAIFDCDFSSSKTGRGEYGEAWLGTHLGKMGHVPVRQNGSCGYSRPVVRIMGILLLHHLDIPSGVPPDDMQNPNQPP